MFQSTAKIKEKTEEEQLYVNHIDAFSFENSDISCDIGEVTEKISMALVRALPPGSLNKMLSGIPVRVEKRQCAILEISTEAKYNFKETGCWSRWPDPRRIHYSEYRSDEPNPINASSEVSCQFLLLESPALVDITFENELVYSFFREKLLNKLVKAGNTIGLMIKGFSLPFIIGYAYPEGVVRVEEKTLISFMISTNKTTRIYPSLFSNEYTERIYPFPPEEFLPKLPSRYREVIEGAHNKQYLAPLLVDLAYNKHYLTKIE